MPSITITPPKASIPVGSVTINGIKYDVPQHPEFVRFFYDFFRRIGGTDGSSSEQLQTQIDGLSFSPTEQDTSPQDAGIRALGLLPPYPEATPQEQRSDGRIEALEAEVQRLSVIVNGLTMGYQL